MCTVVCFDTILAADAVSEAVVRVQMTLVLMALVCLCGWAFGAGAVAAPGIAIVYCWRASCCNNAFFHHGLKS
jgi:hypothetical protein